MSMNQQTRPLKRTLRRAAASPLAFLLLTGCTSAGGSAASPGTDADAVPWPVTECGTYTGEGCAPVDALVDLDKPTFSNPTEITNPLYPISELESVVLLGVVDDLPFRSETTLLPNTETVIWDGEAIEVRLVQYMAFSDGRITEIALDRYAQADDGSVWYFGEDVYDYVDGVIDVTEGTWLAGRDGSPAMIMPADPKLGDVFRPETVIGIVFEEVTVTAVNETFDGPRGPVNGVLVGTELHLDGAHSDKLFAPGYGEFYSESDGEIEALAIARMADSLAEPEPPELRGLITAAWGLVEAARLEDWDAAPSMLRRLQDRWLTVGDVTPPRVGAVMESALASLDEAIASADVAGTIQASINVAQSAIDVQLRYRSAPAVDIARFHVHSQQLRLDAANDDRAGVDAEVATLEWILQRLDGHLASVDYDAVAGRLTEVRSAAAAGNVATAADLAARLAADLNSVAAATPGLAS
jgi:hypothetical protein